MSNLNIDADLRWLISSDDESSNTWRAFPNAQHPRWIAPDKIQLLQRALTLALPTSNKARLASKMLHFSLPLMYSVRRLLGTPLSYSSKVIEELAEMFGMVADTIVMSMGTLGPGRKAIFYGQDKSGTFRIAKMALRTSASELVQAEAKSLLGAAVDAWWAKRVPSLYSSGQYRDHAFLVEAVIGGRPATAKDLPSIISDIELAPATGNVELSTWAERLTAVGAPHLEMLVDQVCATKLGGVVVKTGRIHGDFAPWNVRVQPHGIGYFDLESSRERQPLCIDKAYACLASAILLNDRQSRNSVAFLSEQDKCCGILWCCAREGINSFLTQEMLKFWPCSVRI